MNEWEKGISSEKMKPVCTEGGGGIYTPFSAPTHISLPTMHLSDKNANSLNSDFDEVTVFRVKNKEVISL